MVKDTVNLEKIKLIGETIQVYVVIVSLIVAGIWALNTFFIVHKDEIKRKPTLEANIKATQIGNEDEKYIKATVTVKNTGNEQIWLDLGISSLAINKVIFNEDDKVSYEPVAKKTYKAYIDNTMALIKDIKEVEISQNSEHIFSYVEKVTENDAGLFYVSFLASQRHRSSRESLNKKGYGEYIVMSVQASDYVYIQ